MSKKTGNIHLKFLKPRGDILKCCVIQPTVQNQKIFSGIKQRNTAKLKLAAE